MRCVKVCTDKEEPEQYKYERAGRAPHSHHDQHHDQTSPGKYPVQPCQEAHNIIIIFQTSSLLALTAAEADPQLLYGAGLPYAAGVPYVGATVGAVAHAPVVKVKLK